MTDPTRLAHTTPDSAATTELRGALQQLPLRRDEPPSIVPAGAALIGVLAVAIATAWWVRRRRQPGNDRVIPADEIRSASPQPTHWLNRALGVGDPNVPRVVGTMRLGTRGQLHVVRWHGRELLVGTAQGGSPSLVAERTVEGAQR